MNAKKLKLVGSKSKKKAKVKQEEEQTTVLLKSSIKWIDAFPYLEETYRLPDGSTTEVPLFFSEKDDEPYEEFLYRVIRCNSLPTFIKNNFKKIKKLVEKELAHRDKMYEKLSKEQAKALETYFDDNKFFERDESDEYFEHEMEKVFIAYLKAYLDTRLYESKARQSNRRRRQALKKLGLE